MKSATKFIIVILIVISIIAIPVIGGYNKLVHLDQTVSSSEAHIETQLQRRMDLIPGLVNTVKGYASQEKDIFTHIADARSRLAGATTLTEQAQADGELSNALSRLLLIVERYPELKSNQNFMDLSVQLEGTENRIAIARNDYNTSVTAYNTQIRRFPSNIIASIFGFSTRPLYKANVGADTAPIVDFSNL